MKRFFHKELEEIRGKIIHIGEKANDAGRLAVGSFIESDLEKAQAAMKMDDKIDAQPDQDGKNKRRNDV